MRTRSAVIEAAALGGMLLLSLLPALSSQVDDVDVLIYAAAAARANAESAPPYVAAWVEKGPAAMALYQLLDRLAGPYPLLAIGGTVVVLHGLALLAVRGAARRLVGPAAGTCAGVLYAVAAGAVGGTLNTEVPAAAAAAGAWWAWVRSDLPGRRGVAWVVLAGALASVALLCRQNAGVLWPVLLAGEGLRWAWPRRGRPGGAPKGEAASLRAAALRAVGLSAGFALPAAAVVLGYAAVGAFPVFWFCVYGYNATIYVAATQVTASRLAAIPLDVIRHFLAPTPTLAVLGLAGAALTFQDWRFQTRDGSSSGSGKAAPSVVPDLAATVLAAVATTASLVLGLRFFEHYAVLALPFWAVLGGAAAGRLLAAAEAPSHGARRTARAVVVVLAAGLALELVSRDVRRGLGRAWRIVAHRGAVRAEDPATWPGVDPLSASVGKWIRERAAPGDRLFVWGMRPHVYATSGLLPGTRFVIGTFLTGLVPWERIGSHEDTRRWIVPGSRALLMEDLRRERPRFVVDASQDRLFGEGAYPVASFPELASFLREAYAEEHAAGTVNRMVVWVRRDGEW